MLNTSHSEVCVVLKLYNLLGRKWTCPLLINFKPEKCYSFEDIIKSSSRKIHRTLLSTLLKDMISVGIVQNNDNCYKLTKKGVRLQEILQEIKRTMQDTNDTKDLCNQTKNCLVYEIKA
jgi:DNA-binding HxlR family transcriptional regulator